MTIISCPLAKIPRIIADKATKQVMRRFCFCDSLGGRSFLVRKQFMIMQYSIRASRQGEVIQQKKDGDISKTYFIFLSTQMFDRHLCWQQLKYSGMLETVKYDLLFVTFYTMSSGTKAILALILISK